MRISFDLVRSEEPKVVSVDKWYDRYSRSWIVQLKDESGNQVGDAMYFGNRESAEKEYSHLIKEYVN